MYIHVHQTNSTFFDTFQPGTAQLCDIQSGIMTSICDNPLQQNTKVTKSYIEKLYSNNILCFLYVYLTSPWAEECGRDFHLFNSSLHQQQPASVPILLVHCNEAIKHVTKQESR